MRARWLPSLARKDKETSNKCKGPLERRKGVGKVIYTRQGSFGEGYPSSINYDVLGKMI